jgi:hypothetical protein
MKEPMKETLDEILGVISHSNINTRRRYWIRKMGSRKSCYGKYVEGAELPACHEVGGWRVEADECCAECINLTRTYNPRIFPELLDPHFVK